MLKVNFEDTEDIGIVTHYNGNPFTGIGRHLYENGNPKDEIEMVEGLKHGKSQRFSEEGILIVESHYKKDKLNGRVTVFNKKGIITKEGSFIDGKKEGIFKEYNDEGVLECDLTYKDDVQIDRKNNPDLPQFYFAQKIIDEANAKTVQMPSAPINENSSRLKEDSAKVKYEFEKDASEFESIKEIIDFLKSDDGIKIRVEACEEWDGYFQLTNDKKSDNIKHNNLYDQDQGDQIIMVTEKDGKQEVSGEYFVDLDGNKYDLKKQTYEGTVYLWQHGLVDKDFLIDQLNEFVDEDNDNLSADLYDFFAFLDMPQCVHDVMELFQVSDQTGNDEYSWHVEYYINHSEVNLIFCK